ncbi:helix-turn-helix domain-containing protein [Vibrio vulnificus]|nr:helix-turn-helix domain-containing protein [Vibrio vulnificus]
MDSLNNLDFKKLASQQKSIQMKMRLLALAHCKDGHSRTQIAKFLKVSRASVNKWVQTFLEEGLDNVDVWFQDEARFGQQNTTTRLWVERGSRPRVVKQQQFEYAYLFGSVCPARGIGEAMVVP